MSLIPHTFLPRSMFDMDAWAPNFGLKTTPFGFPNPTTFDMFDPFDEMDRMMSRNLKWINKPAFLDFNPIRVPQVPTKYRISLDCRGYSPKSIKTEIKDGKLCIHGAENVKTDKPDGDFSIKEFKKTYVLPTNVETDKMVSFVTSHGHLVVEMPLKHDNTNQSLVPSLPQITDGPNGTKTVSVKINLPKHIEPSKVSVTCKDHDLIIKAEDKVEKPDGYSQTYYYQRTTLPEHTDFNALKCLYDNNQLSITAPVDHTLHRADGGHIPIQDKFGIQYNH